MPNQVHHELAGVDVHLALVVDAVEEHALLQRRQWQDLFDIAGRFGHAKSSKSSSSKSISSWLSEVNSASAAVSPPAWGVWVYSAMPVRAWVQSSASSWMASSGTSREAQVQFVDRRNPSVVSSAMALTSTT